MVNPTVGLPLFLGSVAVTSLIVHYSVLSNTTWFGAYWNGHAKAKVAAVETTTQPSVANTSAGPGFVISVAPVAGNAANGETSFVISVAPKPVSTAQAEGATAPVAESLALASPAGK